MTETMTPREYELLARDLAAAVVEQVEGTGGDARSGPKNRFRGVSGYEHQIDASVLFPKDVLLIECKRYRGAVRVPEFLTFVARVLDIRPAQEAAGRKVHASVVTTKDFQAGVHTLARYYGIDIARVRSPLEFGQRYKNLAVDGVRAAVSWRGSSPDEHRDIHGDIVADN